MAFALQLDLTRHCIETEIKRQHNRAVSSYFRTDKTKNKRLEQIIEVTRQALESWDFHHLRSEYAPLAGQCDARAVLTAEDNRIGIVLDSETIFPGNKRTSRRSSK